MLPHLLWRISKGLGSNIIPRGRVSLDHRMGRYCLGFLHTTRVENRFFGGLHMVAPSKGEIFEDARAHEVFPWRALYELTKTKTKQKKNWCLLCRLDFTLKLVFSCGRITAGVFLEGQAHTFAYVHPLDCTRI